MKRSLKPKAYIYPLPVLIIGSYDENGIANAMTAAWGTVCDLSKVSICIDKTHKTAENILKTKAFTVAIADIKNVIPADFVGIVSANKVNEKLVKTGWHAIKSEVVNVLAEESILNENGKIDLSKFKPICYDTDGHGYYALGEKVGNAFSDGNKLK